MYIKEECRGKFFGKVVAFYLRDAEWSCIPNMCFKDEYALIFCVKDSNSGVPKHFLIRCLTSLSLHSSTFSPVLKILLASLGILRLSARFTLSLIECHFISFLAVVAIFALSDKVGLISEVSYRV